MKSLSLIICITLLLGNAFKTFAIPPTLVINNPAAVCFPATVDLTAPAITAGSSLGLTYTWWLNDSATIAYNTPSAATAGKYFIKGTDVNGEYTVSPIVVNVNPLLTPEVSIASNIGNNICVGNSITFTALAVNAGTPSYQWRKGLTNIQGATNSTYTSSTLSNGNAINVVIKTHDICATSTSATRNTINMIVNPIVVPSIMISVLNNNVCSGVTYAAVIANGGSAPSYQWQLNGVNISNAINDSYTASGLKNDDIITCVLTSNALCASPASVVSNKLKVNLMVPTTTWLGIDHNFNAETNWSNGIPNSNLSAIIRANTAYSPVIYSDAAVYSLLIHEDAMLTINGANALSIYGSFTNNGTFNAAYSSVNFTGCLGTTPILHTISSTNNKTTIFNNIILNDSAGLKLNNNSALTGSLILMNGTLNNDDNIFTLISTKDATASFGPVANTSAYIGNITMQQFVPGPLEGWTTFGSAVTGASLEQWEDNFPLVDSIGSYLEMDGFKAIFTYNEIAPGPFDTISSYVCPTDKTNKIILGTGYLAYLGNGSDTADITIALTGKPHIGDFDFNPTFNNSGNNFDGFNLVANPYPSTIDWTAPTWNKLNMNDAIYTYLSNVTQYASYVNGVGTNGGSPFINSSQGFYVQAIDTNAVLIANENVKVNHNAHLLVPNKNSVTDKMIKFKLAGYNYTDEAVIRFNELATNKFDKSFDAYKILCPDRERPAIATLSNDIEYSINTMTLDPSVSIPVKVLVSKFGTYSINFEGVESFPSNYCIVFEDLYTQIKTDITQTKTYTFEMSDTSISPRFIIHLIAPLKVFVSDANAGNGSDGAISIIDGNNGWLFELRNKNNELISAGKANEENKMLGNLKAGDYVLYLDNGMGNKNMNVPLTVATKTNPTLFENNNTVFINKGEAHVTLNDTTAFGDSYIWDFGDGKTLGTIEPKAAHAYTKDGRYQVTITSDKEGKKTVKNLVIDVFDTPDRNKSMDIQNINGDYYAVFKFDKTTQVTMQITNMNGQMVVAPQLIEGVVGCQKIEIPEFTNGLCIITITDGKNTIHKKINKKG